MAVAGCGAGDTNAPPEIRWGEEICDFCHMAIEDRRFAAGYRLANGEARKFDDIGDMVLSLAHEAAGAAASIWVRDYDADRWLEATTAFVVESPRIESPMGYGLAAVATESRAQALAREVGGTMLTWQQLKARGVTAPRVR